MWIKYGRTKIWIESRHKDLAISYSENSHLGLAQNVPGVLPRAVHGDDSGVRIGHCRQLSQIAQIPSMQHQLESHAGLSVSIPAADVIVIAVALSRAVS